MSDEPIPFASMAVVTAVVLYVGSGTMLFVMLGPVRTRAPHEALRWQAYDRMGQNEPVVRS